MGGCQNYDPFLGTLNIRCHVIMGIQKGTIILTTTLMNPSNSQKFDSRWLAGNGGMQKNRETRIWD